MLLLETHMHNYNAGYKINNHHKKNSKCHVAQRRERLLLVITIRGASRRRWHFIMDLKCR